MSAYVRQSTYTDGDAITAAHTNDEFNALVNAFNATTGHKHDGPAGEGPAISLIGDAGVAIPINKVVVNNASNSIDLYVDVAGVSTKQFTLKDGVIEPTTDDDVDLGSSTKQFKDLYIDGIALIDTLSADTLGAPLDAASQAITNANIDTGDIASAVVINKSPVVTLTGDVTGAATLTNLASGSITTSIADATTTTKGLAQFNSTDFTVASGVVSLSDESIEDISSAMFTGNTETGITVTYDDADGTVDFVTDVTLTGTETLTNK